MLLHDVPQHTQYQADVMEECSGDMSPSTSEWYGEFFTLFGDHGDDDADGSTLS